MIGHLINERIMYFSPTLAREYGVEEAVVIQAFHAYLMEKKGGNRQVVRISIHNMTNRFLTCFKDHQLQVVLDRMIENDLLERHDDQETVGYSIKFEGEAKVIRDAPIKKREYKLEDPAIRCCYLLESWCHKRKALHHCKITGLPIEKHIDAFYNWAESFRLMHEQDGYSWDEIEKIVNYIMTPKDGWSYQTFSPSKIRKKVKEDNVLDNMNLDNQGIFERRHEKEALAEFNKLRQSPVKKHLYDCDKAIAFKNHPHVHRALQTMMDSTESTFAVMASRGVEYLQSRFVDFYCKSMMEEFPKDYSPILYERQKEGVIYE